MRKICPALFGILSWTASSLAQPVVSESKFIEVDHLKVHYTNYGKGETALLLVHGWACDETIWAEQAPVLADKIRVITVDLPGHGQSDKPLTIEYNTELYTRAIDAVLTDANVKSAILVGHSNGTPFVREYLRKFPAKVKALVVVEGSLRPLFDKAALEKFVQPLRDDYREAMSRFVDSMIGPIKDAALRDRIKALMLKTPQQIAVSELEATADEELWKPDKIDIPVLMVLAKQPLWSPDYEQFVRKLVPKLDYQVWPNVSHFLMMEKPREFNAAVLKFLEQNQLVPNRS